MHLNDGNFITALPLGVAAVEDGEPSPSAALTFGAQTSVQNLLQQMQGRFQTMSESIVTKVDEMGARINELEQSINDLRAEMGAEGSPSPLPPSKKPDDVKLEEGSA